jgi:hypothetical protein
MRRQSKTTESTDSSVLDVRVPSESEISENPKRRDFLGGAWVDSQNLNVVNLYWHKRREQFSVYSLLNVLEHETLHSVLARRLSIQLSMKLDRVHRSSCVWIDKNKLVFINEFKISGNWVLPSYFEEPTEDLLE